MVEQGSYLVNRMCSELLKLRIELLWTMLSYSFIRVYQYLEDIFLGNLSSSSLFLLILLTECPLKNHVLFLPFYSCLPLFSA